MNKCPKCGHEWPDEKRASGGKARWAGVDPAERKSVAKMAANARWFKSGKGSPKKATHSPP